MRLDPVRAWEGHCHSVKWVRGRANPGFFGSRRRTAIVAQTFQSAERQHPKLVPEPSTRPSGLENPRNGRLESLRHAAAETVSRRRRSMNLDFNQNQKVVRTT